MLNQFRLHRQAIAEDTAVTVLDDAGRCGKGFRHDDWARAWGRS